MTNDDAAAAGSATRLAPAGWYQDPEAPDLLRWWDGATWSDTDFEPMPLAPSLHDRIFSPKYSFVTGVLGVWVNSLFTFIFLVAAWAVSPWFWLSVLAGLAGVALSIRDVVKFRRAFAT